MTQDTMTTTIRLFKAAMVKQSSVRHINSIKDQYIRALKFGIELSPELVKTIDSTIELKRIVDRAIGEFGTSATEVQSTFYKSFSAVENATDVELATDQLIHYMTTYGGLNDLFGIPVYIPNENVEIDEKEIHAHFVQIALITKEELGEKVHAMLESGMALAERDVKDLVQLIRDENIEYDINKIKNKEALAMIASEMADYPKDVASFLRVLIYQTTGNLLLIQNMRTFSEIRRGNTTFINENLFANKLAKAGFASTNAFDAYIEKYGIRPLAENFNRYRDIFVAFKNDATRTTINRIARKSKTMHKSFNKLNIGNILNAPKDTPIEKLEEILENASVFNLVKVFNSMNFRARNSGKEMTSAYRIRNGRTFVREDMLIKPLENGDLEQLINAELIKRFKHLEGRKVLLPKNVDYTVPTSQKDMLGVIPSGTIINLPESKKLAVGISWDQEMDLDLSATTANGQHFGWNGYYGDMNLTFSGDMTRLNPNTGFAAEQFQFNAKTDEVPELTFNVNNYCSHSSSKDAQFTLFAGESKGNPTEGKDLASISTIDFQTKLSVAEFGRSIIGTILNLGNGPVLVMTNRAVPNSGRVANPEENKKILEGLKSRYQTMLTLSDVLATVNAELVTENDLEEDDEFIDLRPEALAKDTIINLMSE